MQMLEYDLGLFLFRRSKRVQLICTNMRWIQTEFFVVRIICRVTVAEKKDEGKKREGKRLLERALNEKVEANIVMQVGMIEYELGMIGNAEVYLEKAVELDPELRSAHLNLALVKKEMKKFQESRKILEKTTQKFADYSKAWVMLCDFYINHLKTAEPEVIKNAEPEVIENSEPELIKNAEPEVNENSEAELIENCFKRVLDLDPKNFHSQHNLCIFYIDSKKKPEAQNCIGAAKKLTKLGLGYAAEHAAVLETRFNKEFNSK